MGIPKQVQAQVDQAEALHQELYPTAEPAQADTAVQTAPEEPPAEPASNVVELQQKPEPVAAVEVPPKPMESDEAKLWKQKYESLQGKFNSEVPLLHQRLREQGQQLQQLLDKVNEKPAAPEPKAEQLVTSKDVEDYGADLIDMTRRVALETVGKVVAQEIAKLRGEFGTVQAQVGQVADRVVQSDTDRFWASVMSLVPDWKTIDADPDWIAFLNTSPEFAEDTYRELAGKAIAKGDAHKIAKLVEIWRGPQQVTPPPEPKPDAQAELRAQVAPTKSRASGTPQPAGKIWSGADYEAAYDVRNVQRYGQKKADEMIAEADRAVAEGRVRWA